MWKEGESHTKSFGNKSNKKAWRSAVLQLEAWSCLDKH